MRNNNVHSVFGRRFFLHKYLATAGLLLAAASLCTRCSKESAFDPNDTNIPVITIQSPLTGEDVQGTINIKAKASDTEKLRSLVFVITRRGDTAVLYEKTFDVRDLPFYIITESWTPGNAITEATELKLTITASDYGDNTISESTEFEFQL